MPKAKTPKVKLTNRLLESLKAAPTGKRRELRDVEAPGLCVRITDKGLRTFLFRARYPGSSQTPRRALGEYPAMTLGEVREKAIEWRKLIARGIDPAIAEARQRAATIERQANTFAAVAEAFIAEKVIGPDPDNPIERKGREVARDIRNEFTPKWGSWPITEITDGHVLDVIEAKAQTAPAQARNLLGTAKRLFAWAKNTKNRRRYGLASSPAADLKPREVIGDKISRDRILSDLELLALWRAAERLPYPHGPVYQLLILNGLRLNEAADAAKTEFDSPNLLWTIPASRMKSRRGKARPHAVPLTSDTLAIVNSLPKLKGDYLFSTTYGKSPTYMSDKVKKRIDSMVIEELSKMAEQRGDDPAKVKLAHWTNHDIRRTVRSGLSRLKIAEEVREAVVAHVRPGIKGTYDLYDYLDEKRDALELWATHVRSLVTPAPTNVVPLHGRA